MDIEADEDDDKPVRPEAECIYLHLSSCELGVCLCQNPQFATTYLLTVVIAGADGSGRG